MTVNPNGCPRIQVLGINRSKEIYVDLESQRAGWRCDTNPVGANFATGVYIISNRDGRVIVLHAPKFEALQGFSISFHHPISDKVILAAGRFGNNANFNLQADITRAIDQAMGKVEMPALNPTVSLADMLATNMPEKAL